MKMCLMLPQYSGDMFYAPPGVPVRGADSVYRLAPSMLRWKSDEADGPGVAAGTYSRTTPYVMNATYVGVVSDVYGGGTNADSVRTQSLLTDPAYLLSTLSKG